MQRTRATLSMPFKRTSIWALPPGASSWPTNLRRPAMLTSIAGASLLGAATGAYIVSKYREAYQTERIAPEVYVKDVDLEGR